MLPQNAHQLRQHQQQQPGLPSFMPSNSSFDPSNYFNLDPSQAAKQMAALTAASQARMANSRGPSASLAPIGTSSASYLGGINSGNHPAGSHDPLSASVGPHANFQMPSSQGLAPPSNPGANAAAFLDPSMSQATAANRSFKQRHQGFLNGLAGVMLKRGTPLPPTLTGMPTPTYDPNNTPWKGLEPSSTVGSFRLAGKDVDLFKLWGIVYQNGGGALLTSTNGWGAVLPQFDLPEEIPQTQTGSLTSVAALLSQHYMALLFPFEEMYKRNMQDQHKRAQMASRQAGPQGPQPPSTMSRPYQNNIHSGAPPLPGQMQRGMVNPMGLMNQGVPGPHTSMTGTNGNSNFPPLPQTPQTPQQRPSSAALNIPSTSNLNNVVMHDSMVQPPHNQSSDVNVLDQDTQGMKRKMVGDDDDSKRARLKTGSEPPESTSSAVLPVVDRSSVEPSSNTPTSQTPSTTMPAPPRRQQPSRRKIEYVPLAREVETYGGRDLKFLETELANLPQRRPLRDINEWGIVDIEALTMSIRSRISTELSYALTTFTVLSTMRGQTPGSGFPVFQCADLFDEVLDLLEEGAFGERSEDKILEFDLSHDGQYLPTNRELISAVYETESHLFAALEHRQGSKDPDLGPRQRPGNIVLAIVNIIRNLSTINDNLEFISRHDRLIDLLLRLCTVVRKKGVPSPASPVLSLGDLISIRKDTLYVFANIAGQINLSGAASPSKDNLRMANRAFMLIASYLIDPVEAVSPLACIQSVGSPSPGNLKPPFLADMALEVYTRLCQSDTNRQIFAKAVPQPSVWSLFVSLTHRLPVVDLDFQLVSREHWLSYLEKIIMAIYSLLFLAPPEMKQRVKSDRRLGFKAVMLRMLQKFLVHQSQEGRVYFLVCARRAIEAMKVLDEAADSFDIAEVALPTMSFGMGYGEVGDASAEKGTGLLGGHRELAWDMLMLREVQADEVMFGELESLARVE
ncbi:hypothetical protein BD779DRAFT_1484669 [Infundibulicybe gibba]|nr:hypothetical protein BD779DRAFT_1484669 [Infundibulicybe gibba]